MAINILIGVGGTGAKTVEAALVLLLAGMVDDPVYVGMVDQDESNGNVARATDFLGHIHQFRKFWSSGESTVDWNKTGWTGLGSNKIIPLFSGDTAGAHDCTYRPNAANGATLEQMIGTGLTKDQAHLFDMLFMDDEHEQRLEFDQGYRGRAHVGSAAFLASIGGEKNKFFDAITSIVESAGGQTVNVFFVGSAFGGTGAAGFPTLARRLHKLREEAAFTNAANVRIGGMLMLPYFLFDSPKDAAEAVVTPDELLPKTQLALEYYHNLFQHEPCFDMFYTMGWNPSFPMNYHEKGSAVQANPALPAELVAATAAVDFFRKMTDNPDIDQTRVHMSARMGSMLNWADLPCEAPQMQEYRQKLGQLIRFCVYWRYFFFPHLAKPKPGFFGGKVFAHKLADHVHPSDAVEVNNELNAVITGVLNWAATTEVMAGRVTSGQNLWHLGAILDSYHDGFADPTRPAKLAAGVSDGDWGATFNSLIEVSQSGDMGRSAEVIYEDLKTRPPEPNHSGIGKALVSVFHACRLNDAKVAL